MKKTGIFVFLYEDCTKHVFKYDLINMSQIICKEAMLQSYTLNKTKKDFITWPEH